MFLAQAVVQIHFLEIAVNLLGGLALFLFGMNFMTEGLKVIAGDGLKTILKKMTVNRFAGVFSGILITAATQSSSVTTVLLVGFASAGLLTFVQSIGVILGANIGSTLTTQIIAFNIIHYAMYLIVAGFGLWFLSNRPKWKHAGGIVFGTGLVFFGMGFMGEATGPLRSWQPFIDMLSKMDNPVLGILAGLIFTAIIQSSAATTGLVIVLAAQGSITLEAGIAVALGANIGTCITAALAAIGKPTEALRIAVVHVLLKVFGVLIWIALIPVLADWVRRISPTFPNLTDAERMARETPRQIANAHTLFNIANTCLFIWFVNPLAKLVEKLVPARRKEKPAIIIPDYIHPMYLKTPTIALMQTRLEIIRMGNIVLDMFEQFQKAITNKQSSLLKQIEHQDDDVDELYLQIVKYIGKIGQENLTELQTQAGQDMLTITNYIENLGDLFETNLVKLGLEIQQKQYEDKQIFHNLITQLCSVNMKAFETVLQALDESDTDISREKALGIIDLKKEIDDISDKAIQEAGLHLIRQHNQDLDEYKIESELAAQFKRVYYLIKRIAKIIYADSGLLTDE